MLEARDLELDGAGSEPAAIDLQHAAWLSPGALLLYGSLHLAAADVRAVLVDEGAQELGASAHTLFLEDAAIVVVTAPGLDRAAHGEATIELRQADAVTRLDRELLGEVTTDVPGAVRQRLAPLEASERERAVEFLAGSTAWVPDTDRAQLCERLSVIREALRERLPACVISEDQPLGVHIDRVLVVDDRSFYLEGWLHDDDAAVVSLTAVSPEGGRAELLERMYRYPRPDVAGFFSKDGAGERTKHGFHCFVELDAPSMLSQGWLLELTNRAGVAVEVGAPPVTRDALDVLDAILWGPEYERLPDDSLMANHVYPAISRIQKQVAVPKIDRVVQFGTPPVAPDISIVVPVYKRLDHLEMQLSEFVHDPEFAEVDLVYVLDSPDDEHELLEEAAQLTPLYNVPFRVAVLDQNVGFAGANNAGASLAKGRMLLLLNSDILPDRPGWLSRMRDFYDSVPHMGALGVKLLYEDDSIQHAGMYMYQPPGSKAWIDAHYFKGMHRSLPGANVARQVPLVSGACMMIERSLYEQLGGLRGIYVKGDYEDSDLCLQLTESGREIWYLPDVELYHLEGQSYSADADQARKRYITNRYNAWVHSHLWSERIALIMQARDDGGPGSGPERPNGS